MNKLQESIIREFIRESLVLEEKEILEEGLVDNLKHGIPIALSAIFGGINPASADSPNKIADLLAQKMPDVSSVEYSKSSGLDEFKFTDNAGEKHSVILNRKEIKNLKGLSRSNLLKLIKQSVDDAEGGGPELTIAGFRDAVQNLKDAASDIETSDIKKDLEKISIYIKRIEKYNKDELVEIYNNSVEKYEAMSLSITGRRLAEEYDLPKSSKGRIIYVKAMFDKSFRKKLISSIN